MCSKQNRTSQPLQSIRKYFVHHHALTSIMTGKMGANGKLEIFVDYASDNHEPYDGSIVRQGVARNAFNIEYLC